MVGIIITMMDVILKEKFIAHVLCVLWKVKTAKIDIMQKEIGNILIYLKSMNLKTKSKNILREDKKI